MHIGNEIHVFYMPSGAETGLLNRLAAARLASLTGLFGLGSFNSPLPRVNTAIHLLALTLLIPFTRYDSTRYILRRKAPLWVFGKCKRFSVSYWRIRSISQDQPLGWG